MQLIYDLVYKKNTFKSHENIASSAAILSGSLWCHEQDQGVAGLSTTSSYANLFLFFIGAQRTNMAAAWVASIQRKKKKKDLLHKHW